MPTEPTGEVLSRLTGLGGQDFADGYWDRRHLHSTARAGESFGDIFSLAAAEELITRRGLRTPFLRLVRDGTAIPRARFTASGGVGATIDDQIDDARVRDEFAHGATIVLQGLHRTWAPIGALARALAAELGHPVQCNGYITPSGNQGFAAHYDVHDVFVVQIHGAKDWILHEPIRPHPLRSEPVDHHKPEVRKAAAQDPIATFTLTEGDCLYLPRGFIHAARANAGISIHLTLGVHPWTRRHIAATLLDQVLDRFADGTSARTALPVGTRVGQVDTVEEVRAAVLTALAELPAEQVATALSEQVRQSMRPAPVSIFGANERSSDA